jgi:hypothetical protein
MECQGSFLALTLATVPSTRSPALTFEDESHAFPSAHVNSEYPYRICETSESFATIFGFKPEELKGGSLRLVFGPETDVGKLNDIICDKMQDFNDRVVLYQKDGNEVACSVYSTHFDTPTGERMSSISILNYKLAQTSTLMIFQQSLGSHEGGEHTKSTTSARNRSSLPCENVQPPTLDPTLRLHLNAIRRSRGIARHHTML